MVETISKDFWEKYQKQVGSGKVSSALPYAFSHIVELSQLPDAATFEVVFNDKTIDEATEQVTEILGYGEYDEEEDEGFQPVYGSMGDDTFSDNIEQAIYQTENPNAVMTPWGPAMDPMDVESMMSDYFGADSLVGLDPNETQGLFDEADAIIDASGGQLDEIVNQADATAMAENLDPNEVGVGIVDEMAGQPLPGEDEDFQPIYGPFEPDDEPAQESPDQGLSWWDRLMGLNIVEAAGPGDDNIDPQAIYQTENPNAIMTPWGPATVEEEDEPGFWERTSDWLTKPTEEPGLLERLGQAAGTAMSDVTGVDPLTTAGAAANTQKVLAIQADLEFLESIEDLPLDEQTARINEALDEGSLFPESLTEAGYQKTTSGYQKIPLTTLDDKEDPVKKTSGDYGAKTSGGNTLLEEIQGASSTIGRSSEDMIANAFYDTLDNTVDSQSGVPLSRMPNIIKNRTRLLNETETLFWLWGGEELRPIRPEGIGSLYSEFLAEYIRDPSQFTSGSAFDEKIQSLRDGLGTYGVGSLYNAKFGRDADRAGDDGANRREILIKIYQTGSSLGEGGQYRYLNDMLNRDELRGDEPAAIFRKYTMPRSPVDAQDPYAGIFAGDGAVTPEVGTTTPYQYDVSGLRDPALSFTPELYSPGTQRFGTPGETMAMRYRRFREDPYQPLSPVYDRTGMQDSALSMTPELMGGGGNRFGNTDWVPDMAVQPGVTRFPFESNLQQSIPGINAAALPLDLDEDMPYYTDSSKGSELYKQAMQDPVMGAAMRARMGLDDVPMIGMPEQLEAEHLASMPEPFDEVERAKRDKGLKYQTGRWTGGPKHKWNAMSPEEKKRIMGTDAWVGGTSFVPTIGWRP